MRKINLFNKSIQLLGLTALVLLSSCKKDVLESKELLVFVQGDFGTANNTIAASLTQTPISIWGKTSFEIPVYSTREVPADVDVYIYPDDRFVGQFNKDNNKKCLLLPANTYTVSGYQHKINAGTLASDPIKIEITNVRALTDTNGYVLPLTVTKIGSEDKGVGISTNKATAYLYVPYIYTNVDSVQTSLTGTLMSRTAWSVTVSNTTSGALGPAMIDGNNSTSWRSSNSSTAAKWAIINLGSQQTVKGFQIVPNYVSASENATQMTISTSNDNVTWTVQGIWKGTGPATGSTAASPDLKGVNFLAPPTAQYFRFDISAWVSGSRVGFGEVNAVQ
ncbi:MAG: discoidin domain-containing protein [Bacteroidota bacterium]|nr:discoidin domain-containing protein [Bacteroidota bacterium]